MYFYDQINISVMYKGSLNLLQVWPLYYYLTLRISYLTMDQINHTSQTQIYSLVFIFALFYQLYSFLLIVHYQFLTQQQILCQNIQSKYMVLILVLKCIVSLMLLLIKLATLFLITYVKHSQNLQLLTEYQFQTHNASLIVVFLSQMITLYLILIE